MTPVFQELSQAEFDFHACSARHGSRNTILRLPPLERVPAIPWKTQLPGGCSPIYSVFNRCDHGPIPKRVMSR